MHGFGRRCRLYTNSCIINSQWVWYVSRVKKDNYFIFRVLQCSSMDNFQEEPYPPTPYLLHQFVLYVIWTFVRSRVLFVVCKHVQNDAIKYIRTSVTRTCSGPWKFVRDIGSSSHWGLIMTPGQEANEHDLGKSFRYSAQNSMLSVLIRITSMRRF